MVEFDGEFVGFPIEPPEAMDGDGVRSCWTRCGGLWFVAGVEPTDAADLRENNPKTIWGRS